MNHRIIVTVALSLILALSVPGVWADDGGADPAALVDASVVAVALDAGPAAQLDAGVAVAANPAPPPLDVVAQPTKALDGFRLWMKTAWPFAVLFAIGSVLIAAGGRVKKLRTGKYAIAIGTALATITVILTAKAAGLSNAQSVAGAMNVLFMGAMWGAWPNRSTVDLSTATPEQIAAALAVANKPSATPTP